MLHNCVLGCMADYTTSLLGDQLLIPVERATRGTSRKSVSLMRLLSLQCSKQI